MTLRTPMAVALFTLLVLSLSACAYGSSGTVTLQTAVPEDDSALPASAPGEAATAEPTQIPATQTAEPSAEPTHIPPTQTAEPTAGPSPTAQPAATAVQYEVETITGVPYALAEAAGAADKTLDIYYAPQAEQPKPVIIWAHGSNLDKSSGQLLGRLLAREGYVLLAIDWSDEITNDRQAASLRAAMEDVQCALRFAATTEEYGADPRQVIWTGYSAGAWIGSMIAFGDGDVVEQFDSYAAENDGPPQQVRCTAGSEPAPITAYIPSAGSFPGDFWFGDGVMDEWTPILAPLQDYSAVGQNGDLRVRILHGKIDLAHDSAYDNAETFAQALDEAGYDVLFLPQDGAHETFQLQVIEQIKALAP